MLRIDAHAGFAALGHESAETSEGHLAAAFERGNSGFFKRIKDCFHIFAGECCFLRDGFYEFCFVHICIKLVYAL